MSDHVSDAKLQKQLTTNVSSLSDHGVDYDDEDDFDDEEDYDDEDDEDEVDAGVPVVLGQPVVGGFGFGLFGAPGHASLYYPQGVCANSPIRMFRKLTDHHFDAIPQSSFSRNFYEQQLFRDYLQEQHIPAQNVWTEGLRKIQDGEYVLRCTDRVQARVVDSNVGVPKTGDGDGAGLSGGDGGGPSNAGGPSNTGGSASNACDDNAPSTTASAVQPDAGGSSSGGGSANTAPNNNAATPAFDGNVSQDDAACYGCASKIFDELCYLYRRKIPRDNLPARGKNRSDCWWGRNCRTQTHNNDHAQRLNHVY
ncbi:hypothetical protein HDV00_006806 [Rhizophlyctis rosea]|nr:hypothetical protein HDV00_006806 [Rhizophlyctis rosea]